MKNKNTRNGIVPVLIMLVAFSFASCSKSNTMAESADDDHDHEAHGHENHEGHDHEQHKGHDGDDHKENSQTEDGDAHEGHGHEGDDHEGHNHDEHGASDLDSPITELFEKECEHGIKAHQCEECRYEVGVVEVHKELFDKGLVTTINAKRSTGSKPLRLTGEIQFDDRRVTHVSTQVTGVIRKVHVTLGDTVTEGQPLLEIESVEIGNAKAVYQEAQAMQRLSQQNFDRLATLRKEGISSQKEMLLAEQELEAAKIKVAAAKGVLRRIGMGGSQKRGVNPSNSSGRLVLRAGSDGTVLEMHAVDGEVAKENESLVTIGENNTLWVWADLYESNYALVSAAQSIKPLDAEISVKAFPDRKFKGVVDYISPAMSEVSRTVKVRITVPNHDGKLLAGMFADVDIFIPGNDSVATLPTGAVLRDDGRTFVFVHHEGDYYVRRPVEAGAKLGNQIAIHSGVSASDRIVANGAFLLKSDVLRSKMGAGCAH